jgi:hypothetical protein
MLRHVVISLNTDLLTDSKIGMSESDKKQLKKFQFPEMPTFQWHANGYVEACHHDHYTQICLNLRTA